MPADDIEINVIDGYRMLGIIILFLGFAQTGILILVTHGAQIGSSLIPQLFTVPCGAILGLMVSRVRFSSRLQQVTIESGVWPFVSQRVEDASDGMSFVIRPRKKGIRVELELSRGRRSPLLENVSGSRFDALAAIAPTVGARLVLGAPIGAVPEWVKSRIGRFGIERSV